MGERQQTQHMKLKRILEARERRARVLSAIRERQARHRVGRDFCRVQMSFELVSGEQRTER